MVLLPVAPAQENHRLRAGLVGIRFRRAGASCLVAYTPDRDLAALVLVEPSCGSGAFLGPIVDRLIASATLHGRDLLSLDGAIRAFDLLDANAELARKGICHRLHEAGAARKEAEALVRSWVTTGDFLLKDQEPASADFVVGNPPYIRLEGVAPRVMDAYRRLWPTMRGRSDIYGLELEAAAVNGGRERLVREGVAGEADPAVGLASKDQAGGVEKPLPHHPIEEHLVSA
ncbi:MAG TPA: hypothetical protein VMZ51_06720 [Acidimicrobiales bacterium]|nr:hypothetical protein [Acidimicrobiales bacterium]